MINNTGFNKQQTMKYLISTFVIAWIMQIGVSILYNNGYAMAGQFLMAIMMFVPLLSVLFSGYKLTGMGWKPHIRGNIKTFLIAWFVPALFTAIGAAVYFTVFPAHFDMSGNYLVESIGAEALKQLETQGLTYPLYILISLVGCLTYAPLINMFFAIGEEAGWRGFLYPQLKLKFGKRKGLLLGGVIWGIWHWPLIWLIGYEYGTDYMGYPVTGMLVFCIFTITVGILCDWLYERSHIIWIPAIFHGAINAAATIPLAVCLTNTGTMRLLGPAPIGILAGLPFILFAVAVFLKSESRGF